MSPVCFAECCPEQFLLIAYSVGEVISDLFDLHDDFLNGSRGSGYLDYIWFPKLYLFILLGLEMKSECVK